MDASKEILPTKSRNFFKPYGFLGVILFVLLVLVTFLMIRVYSASSLLAEANRQSFAQEAKTRISILNEFFEALSSEAETLSNNRALHAYYQNKALGMSLEYGLAVAVAQVRDEFERFQRNELAKKRQIFQQIALLDAKDMRIVVETRPSTKFQWQDTQLIEKVIQTAPKSTMFDAEQFNSQWAAFASRAFVYRDEIKGYLLMRLDLKTLQDQIQLKVAHSTDFDGIADSRGILIVGPQELVGMNIFELLGVSPSVLKQFPAIETHDHRLGDVREPLLVSGGKILGTSFFFVNVAPSSMYLAGYSRHLWEMIFAVLFVGIAIMVFAVSKSLFDQSKMYRKLEEARDTLELRVKERTIELGETNVRLQREIEERTRTQAAFEVSEEKYRNLVEKALEGIVVAQDGLLRFVNRQCSEITGYDLEELLGRPFTDFIHPDHAQMVLERHKRRLKGEQFPSRYSFQIVRKDGEPRWVEIDSGLISWEGQPAVLFFMSDITPRKQMEDELRQSEERYRSLYSRYRDLFEYASDLIYTHDLEGNFTSVNSIVPSLLGYTADEFLSLNFRDILDPQSLQTTEASLSSKVQGVMETTGPYEILVHTKEGTLVWLEVTSRILRQDGIPVGIHGIARNITRRKELEVAVREAQMKYQSVVETFDGLIHIASQNYEIEFANQRLIDRTGYDPVGKKCYEVVHGLNAVCPWCKYGRVPNEETFRRERFSPKDNRWYYVVSTPMFHQDGSISRIFLMWDIDELKRFETERESLREQLVQAQKMEAVGILAGGIAHDFNNLYQVVLGYSQLLLAKNSPDSSQYDSLKKITVAARHAGDLVKGLLAFSRRAESQPRPLDLNRQVEEVKGLLERTIPKMIKIELRLEEDLPVINADPGQIEQILMNLSVNARDAMPDGGVLTITTSTVHLDQDFCKNHVGANPGRHCMLTVSDTGFGMDRDTLEHVFEPFYTTKDVGKGTGLGLAMVYGIVKQHEGFISCESWPGHGTTMRIYFPVAAKEEGELEQVDVLSPEGGFETLLMVDDEDVVRDLGSDYLRLAGYTVLTASNGREALEIYREKQAEISLVLLDLIMPEMGGRRCFEELLKINPHVRVLIVSGYTSGGTEKDATELGARGFVAKPYDLTRLLQTIRDILDEG